VRRQTGRSPYQKDPVILSRPRENAADSRWARDRELEKMPFDFQPTMRVALVELRPLRPGDADDLFVVASDPLIREQHPARDRYKPDVFSAFFREALASRGALTALDCKDGRIIGSSRFHAYNAQTSEAEIGWTFLARSHWAASTTER